MRKEINTAVCFLSIFLVVPIQGKRKKYDGIQTYQDRYRMQNLPFLFVDMEPWIDTGTMKAHYLQIYNGHSIQMNKLLKAWRLEDKENNLTKTSILNIIKNIEQVSRKWRDPLQRAIGGYINHLLYFETMSSNPDGKPTNETIPDYIRWAIYRSYVNFSHFEDSFEKAVHEFQYANGFVWLCRLPGKNYLTIFPVNEDTSPLQASGGLQPLLGIDLWEHAYHVKYPFNKQEYLRNWWKTVNWQKVDEIYKWWGELNDTHDEL